MIVEGTWAGTIVKLDTDEIRCLQSFIATATEGAETAADLIAKIAKAERARIRGA